MGASEPRSSPGAGKRVGADHRRALLADGWSVVAHVHHARTTCPEGATKVVADLADPIAPRPSSPPRRAAAGAAAGQQCRALRLGRLRRVQRRPNSTRTWRSTSARPGAADRALRARARRAATRWSSTCSIRSSPRPIPIISATPCRSRRWPADRARRAGACAARHPRQWHRAGLMLRSSGQSEENFEAMHANNPLAPRRRAGRRRRGAALFDRCAGVTGQVLTIDSGQRFMALERDVQFLGDAMSATSPSSTGSCPTI
jgi:hypothetical protein